MAFVSLCFNSELQARPSKHYFKHVNVTQDQVTRVTATHKTPARLSCPRKVTVRWFHGTEQCYDCHDYWEPVSQP